MTKNEVTKFVQANGGRTCYDGKNRIMYIYDFRGVGLYGQLFLKDTLNFKVKDAPTGGRYANNVA